ncbi:MAG: IS66 family insertion sequence element accessory protein TnpB [Butyrivibrio sp.]|jgi:hypothetical protein|nr:IS66 family insertion sequence element accessory protein TnpB [Butyrivibrio sp.]
MDQITHDVRRNSWLNIVQQCQARPENITVKQWLADNGIKEKAYYYWLRKFRKEAYAQMQAPAVSSTSSEVAFAEIQMHVPGQSIPMKNMDARPVAVIRCNGLSLEISNEISAPV